MGAAKDAAVHADERLLALDQGARAIQCAMQVTAETAARLAARTRGGARRESTTTLHAPSAKSGPARSPEQIALTLRNRSSPNPLRHQLTSRHHATSSAQAADTATVEDRTRWLKARSTILLHDILGWRRRNAQEHEETNHSAPSTSCTRNSSVPETEAAVQGLEPERSSSQRTN